MRNEKILFAGCLVSARFPEYELSSKLVLEAVNISTQPLPGAICCGQVLQGVKPAWIYLAAYNLALAERLEMDMITLCGGCTNTFKRVQSMCRQDPRILADINRVLKGVGLEFHNTIKTYHVMEVFNEHRAFILRSFKKVMPLKAAIMNPCQVFRPADVMQFDNPEHPHVLEDLVSPAVTELIPYSLESRCCGASLSKPEGAFQAGRARLEELDEKGAEVLVTACGNCHLLLHCMQSEYYSGRRIPSIFLPQLLGLAMGFSPEDLMINDQQIRSLVTRV